MKKWAIVINNYMSKSTFTNAKWYKSCLGYLGFECDIFSCDMLCIGLEDKLRDISDVLFLSGDYQLARRIELIGLSVYNSSDVIRICANKVDTYVELLKDSSIAQPVTIPAPYTRDLEVYSSLYDSLRSVLGSRFIIKGAYGSFGSSVFLVNNYDEYIRVVSENIQKQLLFQEFVEKSYGRDVRVIYAFGGIVACMLRESCSDFRSNYSLGGSVSPYYADEEIVEICDRVVGVLGGDLLGIDLLFSEEGYLVCEVNTNPGMEGISIANDRSIPLDIMKKVSKKCYLG